jgi:hypothetical protein
VLVRGYARCKTKEGRVTVSNMSERDWLKLSPHDAHRAAYCAARDRWHRNLPNPYPPGSLDHEAWEIGEHHESWAQNSDLS